LREKLSTKQLAFNEKNRKKFIKMHIHNYVFDLENLMKCCKTLL